MHAAAAGAWRLEATGASVRFRSANSAPSAPPRGTAPSRRRRRCPASCSSAQPRGAACLGGSAGWLMLQGGSCCMLHTHSGASVTSSRRTPFALVPLIGSGDSCHPVLPTTCLQRAGAEGTLGAAAGQPQCNVQGGLLVRSAQRAPPNTDLYMRGCAQFSLAHARATVGLTIQRRLSSLRVPSRSSSAVGILVQVLHASAAAPRSATRLQCVRLERRQAARGRCMHHAAPQARPVRTCHHSRSSTRRCDSRPRLAPKTLRCRRRPAAPQGPPPGHPGAGR